MPDWKLVVGGGLLFVTGAAWLGRFGAIFELLPNGRSQILVVAAVAFLVLALKKAKLPATFALLALAINGFYLLPYATASASTQTASGPEVSVMQFNIFYNNDDTDAIAAHILEADADIAVLHELLPEQWEQMEPALSLRYPHILAEPFRAETGQLSGGMAILASAPLDRQPVPREASPADRVLLVAETELHGTPLTVIGLHPHASRFESRKIELREAQINATIDIANQAEGAVIVATDLNITPTSPTYGHFLDQTGWADPHRTVGWHSTWPTWGSAFGVPIDHVFTSEHLTPTAYETGDGAGSDHRSLVATFTLSQ